MKNTSVHEYDPGCLDHLSNSGGLDRGKMILISVIAQKTRESTWDRIPQQGVYARQWKDENFRPATQDRLRRRPRWPVEQPIPPAPSPSLLRRIFGRMPKPIESASPDPMPNKIAEY